VTAAQPAQRLLRLGNGVPILVRHRPNAPVTTVSTWVLAGSRHETSPGITHLLEHVLMQAAPPGRALRVVDEVEALGGEANAITARDHLVLYARVPSGDALHAAAALADGLTNTDLPADLVDAERQVVDEELRLAASDPNDVVHDAFFAAAFPDHPIGRPVGATPDAVARLSAQDLRCWAAAHVHAGLVAVVVCGDVDAAALVDLLDAGPLGALAPHDRSPNPGEDGPRARSGRGAVALNSDTAALILGGPGFAFADPRLAAAEVVVELLAGGNASVLNEEIRSARGLSYDVWGVATGYRDTGVWRVGMSTAPEHLDEVVDLATGLVRDRVARGWSDGEVAVARRRVAGMLRLEAESSLEDILMLGRYGLVGDNPAWSLERHVEALQRVGVAEVRECARLMLDEFVVATAGSAGPDPEPPAAAPHPKAHSDVGEEETWSATSRSPAGRRS
jgi:predicted Zn-dependent peptidase